MRRRVPQSPRRTAPWWPGRRVAGWLLVATLVTGATMHQIHHLQDPGCGSRTEESHHFCPCSGLHASSLVAHDTSAPLAPVIAERLDAPPSAPASEPERVARDAARAPPRG